MRSAILAVTLFFIATPSAHASVVHSKLPCSIHPKRDTPKADLQAQAKVSQSEAQKTALEALKAASPVEVNEGELEVERGCLVYSFDIHVSGKQGIEEFLVDAGTGKVLEHTHESPQAERAEHAKEK
jgi:uncharacterized membrane protein YkoI